MRKTEKIRYFIMGVVATLVFSTTVVPALAASTYKQLNAYFNDIKLVIDGKSVTPKDGNGSVVEPFIVDGTTYLPVRALCEAIGKTVEWDGKTSTVYVGKRTDTEQYLGEHIKAYQSGGIYEYSLSDSDSFSMSGVTYYRGIIGMGNWDGQALYNLNGQYSIISGMIGHVDGTAMDDKSINFYADGKLIQSFELKASEIAKPFSVDVTGALQIEIEFTRPYISDARYAIADVVIK